MFALNDLSLPFKSKVLSLYKNGSDYALKRGMARLPLLEMSGGKAVYNLLTFAGDRAPDTFINADLAIQPILNAFRIPIFAYDRKREEKILGVHSMLIDKFLFDIKVCLFCGFVPKHKSHLPHS